MTQTNSQGLIVKQSQQNVTDTCNKLISILQEKGFKIFADIDHQAGAASIDLSLAATRTIIFGNPQGGTLLMQSAASASIDLPLKISVYEDQSNKQILIAYNDPQWLADRHQITDQQALVEKLTKALNAMTTAAAE